jgi:hypothetical protein
MNRHRAPYSITSSAGASSAHCVDEQKSADTASSIGVLAKSAFRAKNAAE